jgi:hypothetical protein
MFFIFYIYILTLFVEKGPTADATDAPEPWGLLCNPCVEDKDDYFFIHSSK